MSAAVKKEIEESTRVLLRERLSRCTEDQQEMFARIFHGGPDKVPADDLISAIDLCDRTIRSNEAKPCPKL